MITLKNISKKYTRQSPWQKFFKKEPATVIHAIDNITLTIKPGKVTGLIGPNGAGKTTLVKIITGLLFPSSGEIKVNNFIPTELSNEFKKSVALFRGEIHMLDDGVVVADSWQERLKIYQEPALAKNKFASELIQKMNGEKFLDRTPETLSQGQRTIVEFINAIIHSPSIIILDEPTNGLDIVAIERFNTVLQWLRDKYRATIIITSHNLHNIINASDEIVLINEGKIVLSGTTTEVLEKDSGQRDIRIELKTDPRTKKNSSAQRLIKRENYNFKYPLLTVTTNKKDIVKELHQILDAFEVKDISVVEPSLEKVFTKYYE